MSQTTTTDAESPDDGPLLHVEDLTTSFSSDRGTVRAVRGVNLELKRGKTLGIVGESGSGKSVLSRSIMGLLPSNARRSGTVRFEGDDISDLSGSVMRDYWGSKMSMVFQDPMTALNPVMRIGKQITESIHQHLDVDNDFANETALALLTSVGIPEPQRRLREYPHQMSGGMRQRVMIAIALACGPKLLFADEPTTALDVTVQAQILDLLQQQQRERYMAMILVTHDLGVVAGRADDIAVMYAGTHRRAGPHRRALPGDGPPLHRGAAQVDPQARAAEPHPARGHRRPTARPGEPAQGLQVRPPLPLRPGPLPRGGPRLAGARHARPRVRLLLPGRHPRGRRGPGPQPQAAAGPAAAGSGHREARAHRGSVGLMAGTGTAHLRPANEVLLRVEDLLVEFKLARGAKVHAVTGISFDVKAGETLGLVGESGCGKSTTGKAIMQLPTPTGGKVLFDGRDLTDLSGKEMRKTRTKVQMIFQDPISSLNPRRKIEDIVAEGLDVWKTVDKSDRARKVDEMLLTVGMDPDVARGRRPYQFSGGQCQRISIARAVVTDPELIICDEPVSALDVSVQAQILNLLEDMKARYGLTMIFIAHDLAVVKNISDRVVVMYLGKICEVAAPDELYSSPAHPYTQALLGAIPVPDPDVRPDDRPVVGGEIPSPVSPPSGCRFRTRCPRAEQKCADVEPEMRQIGPDHYVACHFPLGPGEKLVVTSDGGVDAEVARQSQDRGETLPTPSGYVGAPPAADRPDEVDGSADGDDQVDAPVLPHDREVTVSDEPSLTGEAATGEGSTTDEGSTGSV